MVNILLCNNSEVGRKNEVTFQVVVRLPLTNNCMDVFIESHRVNENSDMLIYKKNIILETFCCCFVKWTSFLCELTSRWSTKWVRYVFYLLSVDFVYYFYNLDENMNALFLNIWNRLLSAETYVSF